MRTGLLCAVAALALAGSLPAGAAGLGAAEICTGAGFRAGTVAYDMCLSRVGTDDPLAALEDSDDISRAPINGERSADDDALTVLEHGKGVAVQAVRVPTRNGDLQSFGNTSSFGGGGPQPGNPAGGPTPGAPPPASTGFVAPTAPTAPTAPQINLPFGGSFAAWNFGN